MFLYVRRKNDSVIWASENSVFTDSRGIWIPESPIYKIKLDDYYVLETDENLYLKNLYTNKYRIVDGVIEYAIPQEELDDKWDAIRDKRNELLEKSDTESKIMISDYWALQTSEYKTSWLDYRQALRDITEQEDPDVLEWPINPNEVIEEVIEEVPEEVTENSPDSA